MALGALEAGSDWISEKVKLLEINRKRAIEALSPLGQENITKSEGAIYLWAKLPDGLDDGQVVERLVKEFKVCIIPGSSCGAWNLGLHSESTRLFWRARGDSCGLLFCVWGILMILFLCDS